MREFFDTSVLVAAFWGGHRDHALSVKLLAAAHKARSACAAHSITEVYAVMTALPVRPAIPPEQVLLFVQAMREKLAVVILDEQDHIDTTWEAAESGFTSGGIYDALLLKCAAKVRARTIYTWNLKHFRLIDLRQADKIRTP